MMHSAAEVYLEGLIDIAAETGTQDRRGSQ